MTSYDVASTSIMFSTLDDGGEGRGGGQVQRGAPGGCRAARQVTRVIMYLCVASLRCPLLGVASPSRLLKTFYTTLCLMVH